MQVIVREILLNKHLKRQLVKEKNNKIKYYEQD
jgi:hypothetical protein